MMNDCGHECFVIGGRFIAEDPDCPVHGVNRVECVVCGYPITECDTLEGRDAIICDECFDSEPDENTCGLCGEVLDENGFHEDGECPKFDEDEHDGQPDEMQEWHDFDPDC